MLEVNHGNLDRVKEALLPWLQDKLSEAEIVALPPPAPAAGGGSSQTLFLDPLLLERGQRRERHWVLRVEARDHQIYQDPSVERQYRVMQQLARRGAVPVPGMLWYEGDPKVLGAPFFVMARVPGEVPDAFYHGSGLFTQVTPAEREAMWQSALQALANIHATPVDAVRFLGRPHLGATGLEQELALWDAYREWNGVPPTGVQERARIWLEDHLPRHRPTGLAWGDARLPNMIFSDNRCRAVIDWETASLGGAESDLGWWLFFDWYMTEGVGTPRLPGLPGPGEFVATWESLSGRKVRDLRWHEVFAIWRYAMIRDRALMLFGQRRSADFEREDPALRRLVALLG